MVGEYNNTTMSLKVLTFNVCFGCMSAKTDWETAKWDRTALSLATCQDERCIENVADSIDSEDHGISSHYRRLNHEGIKAVSKQLKSMNHVSGVAGKEE
jgi:hypothetical protein